MRSLISLLIALLAIPALAKEPTNTELAARVAGLEARIALLEGRLGAVPAVGPTTSPQALDMNNWRRCGKNMTKEEVITLLGKPPTEQFASAVNQYPDMETWIWGQAGVGPGGSVVFMGGKSIQCMTVGFSSR